MYNPNKTARSTSYLDRVAMPQKLRPVSPEELDSWSDGDSDATLSEPQPSDLDEPWPYTFQASGFSLVTDHLLYDMTYTARRTSVD